MKRGRKNEWPSWTVKAIREMGFSEDLLETAMKIGLKTIEIDAAQLIDRKRSINEAWNNAPATNGCGPEPSQLGRSEPPPIKDGLRLVENPDIICPPDDWQSPADTERFSVIGERSGQFSTTESVDAGIEGHA